MGVFVSGALILCSPNPQGLQPPVLCCGGNVQGTDLCYLALVAWPGGSGNSVSVLMWEILNIYGWGSWAQHPGSSPRLWWAGQGVVTKPPFSCSPTGPSFSPVQQSLLYPQLLLGLVCLLRASLDSGS